MPLQAVLACALALAACGKAPSEDVPTAAPASPPQAPIAPARGSAPSDARVDGSLATADAVIESASSDALEVRLNGYANLLAIDVSIYQSIEAFPAVPKGTTFEAYVYSWKRPEWLSLAAAEKQVAAILASSSETPSISADAAVHAYAEKLASWLPRLISLAAYIDDKKFVDDEFDRGRRELGDFQRTAAELARLRAPMRGAVFAAWRDLVAEYRDSPRAVAADAWLACMSLADRVMEHAKPEALGKAVSECRRSIPRIAALPAAAGFDADVRTAAIELGDWVAQGYPSWRISVSDALGRLTLRYLEVWPKLATTPAEKPSP